MDSLAQTGDLELKKLLNEWNLIHLYESFMAQKISINVMKMLQPKHIERLFLNATVGDQVIFEHKLELWKRELLFNTLKKHDNRPVENNKFNTNNETAVNTPAIVPQIRTATNLFKSLDTVSGSSNNSIAATPLPTQSKPATSTAANTAPIVANKPPAKIPIPACTVPVRYDLRKILDETSGGQVIVNYYEKHKILREEHRTALINVIARYIDANGCGLSLSESNQLEAQIVNMFPTEKEEFYRTNKRGRIYNKIANMKRVYKKFNMESPAEQPAATSSPSSPSSSTISLIKEEDIEQCDDYVIQEWRSRAALQSPEKYLQFWKKSQKVRLKHIEDIESLQQILDKWPEYKQYNAVQHIHMDFQSKYPEAKVFVEVFEANKRKLEKLLFAKVSTCSLGYKYLQQYEKCSPESQNLIILWVLHQLFPPNHKVVVDEMGNKRKKRYSIQYSQNAFICIRGSQSSLENALKTQLNTATPPMILIVGDLGGDIDQIFVYFEGVRFPMDSVVYAAQLVCELFFLFDLDYPEEAVLYYHFLQTFFLNIEPEVKNTKIYTVINEIDAC